MFWLSQSIWTMTPFPALSVTDNSSKSLSREPVCWPPRVEGEVSPRADDHTPYDIMYALVMRLNFRKAVHGQQIENSIMGQYKFLETRKIF